MGKEKGFALSSLKVRPRCYRFTMDKAERGPVHWRGLGTDLPSLRTGISALSMIYSGS